jgi:hypothetical protein
VNQIDFEKLGIPTVTIVTSEFVGDAKASALGVGMPDMCFVVVPHPMGGISREAIRAKADAAFPDILKAATTWRPTVTELPPPKLPYPAETFKFTGDYEDVYKLFWDRGWTPGLPIVPPTTEAVQAMLKGTSHKPDEVLWEVPPRGGILTVELAAVHAVMAGCKPEYMPVLLAAIAGLRSDKMSWRSATTTTHPDGPFIMVNGPIAKELGIASGTGAAGGWYLPNVSIGFAINLIGSIVGGAKPPDARKSTLGWQGKMIATVVAENEDGNPWEPYHVEKGFKKTDNVVTVTVGGPPVMWQDHTSPTMKQVLMVVAATVNYAGQNGSCFRTLGPGSGEDVFLLLNPEFADLLKKDGWTKDSIRKFIWENGRNPISQLQGGSDQIAEKILGVKVTPQTLVPAAKDPSQVQIIVVGGPGKQGQYWPTCPGAPVHPIMVKIDDWK